MDTKKRRRPGIKAIRDFQNGGSFISPDEARELSSQADFQSYNRERDPGSIKPTPPLTHSKVLESLAYMIANPLDSWTAGRDYDTFLPSREQILSKTSPMGAAITALNPLDEAAAVISSLVELEKGNYVNAAIYPVLSMFPQAFRKSLRDRADKIRKHHDSGSQWSGNWEWQKLVKEQNDEIADLTVYTRNQNPQEFDDMLKQSIINLPEPQAKNLFQSLVATRQEHLGYGNMSIFKGLDPSTRIDQPITFDRFGLENVEGNPSVDAISKARTHQMDPYHPGSGLFHHDEMQRLTNSVPLYRTVRSKDATSPYNVIRGEDRIKVHEDELLPNDIITSLSQPNTEGRKDVTIPGDRAVSTSNENDPLFWSTINKKTNSFTTPFKIQNTKGLPVMRQPLLNSSESSLNHEQEFTLPSNQAFKVVKVGDRDLTFPENLSSENKKDILNRIEPHIIEPIKLNKGQREFRQGGKRSLNVAKTPKEQKQGLRLAHQAGNVNQSMAFPNVPPNTPFNTMGMKAPIDIKKFDKQGNLIKSYDNVPPGVQNLPTGPQKGTVLETPANMQSGGEVKMQSEGTISPDEMMQKLQQSKNPDKLRGSDAPVPRTIEQEKERQSREWAKDKTPDAFFQTARFMPLLGETIDSAELAKVRLTGTDFYGNEHNPNIYAAMTAAGYLIPNILEKPLKSAWRALKKFPSNFSKKDFADISIEKREGILGNLVTAHDEVYRQSGVTNGILLAEDAAMMRNVRQLPSLMSGSNLENSVGKDGMIHASQIKNLISNKNTSNVERTYLQEALDVSTLTGGKIDYNQFRREVVSLVSSEKGIFHTEQTDQYADYGLVNLSKIGEGKFGVDELNAKTNLIRTTDQDLQSEREGHFGKDVIGHYRSFERPDEKGVLYISEMQSDPMQASAQGGGPKRVSLLGAHRMSDDEVNGDMFSALRFIDDDKKMLADLDNVKTLQDMRTWSRIFNLSAFSDDYTTLSIDNNRAIQHFESMGNPFSAQSDFMITINGDAVKNAAINLGPSTGNSADLLPIRKALEEKIALTQAYHDGLEGGWRGGPNPKQASLIKNQDQFLISHVLEQEAKGADKLRFPTGETTGKIQGYEDVEFTRREAKERFERYEALAQSFREMPGVDRAFKEHPMLKGKTDDEVHVIMDKVNGHRRITEAHGPSDKVEGYQWADEAKEWEQGWLRMKNGRSIEKGAVKDWHDARSGIRTSKIHLDAVNSYAPVQIGIMKGYDDLPKALKKHGLEAKKVTDDAGNSWWEVDIPAKLGQGVGEIRSYKKGGKFKILKK